MFLRASMRYRYHFGTFTRGTSKSFLAILSQVLACIFLPNSKRFLVSQFKKASLDIAKQKLEEIWYWYPLLKNETFNIKQSTDYIEITFKNGSIFHILALSASSRGQRATGGIIEEAALIDGRDLNEVIIPMMNVPRRGPDGLVDPNEPHQQQVYITSAGPKTCYAYEKLVELIVQEIIDPDDVFVWGSGYELPVHFGLLDKKFLNEQKLSSSFDEDSFARESASIWTGSSNDSWFNPNKLIRARNLLHTERKFMPNANNPDLFYIIAVDVARYGGNDSSIEVIKVFPHNGAWKKKVVYMENITKTSFPVQAGRIKQLIQAFNPREVVIDGNGLGAGLIDEMVLPSRGPKGELQEPVYVINDAENYPIPAGEKKKALIYNMKANAQLNTEIYSNLYIQVNSGNVDLLANERIVKEKLMATKKGQKMSYLAREKFLLPYVMTSRLIDEINNLKLKPTGAAGQVAVEQISKRINKDRVSALGYGLYRVKFYEDKAIRRNKKSGEKLSMSFFSSHKNRAGDR